MRSCWECEEESDLAPKRSPKHVSSRLPPDFLAMHTPAPKGRARTGACFSGHTSPTAPNRCSFSRPNYGVLRPISRPHAVSDIQGKRSAIRLIVESAFSGTVEGHIQRSRPHSYLLATFCLRSTIVVIRMRAEPPAHQLAFPRLSPSSHNHQRNLDTSKSSSPGKIELTFGDCFGESSRGMKCRPRQFLDQNCFFVLSPFNPLPLEFLFTRRHPARTRRSLDRATFPTIDCEVYHSRDEDTILVPLHLRETPDRKLSANS